MHSQGLFGEALAVEATKRIAFQDECPFDGLREAAAQLAIGDFATGHLALFLLHRFDADVLKIDRRFISELDTDAQTDSLVRAMLDIASHLDMASTAEGVETEAQLNRLRELGRRYAQGYLLARPILVEAFEEETILPSS